MVGIGVVAAEALYLGADEWSFVEVLAFFLVFVDPQVRKHARYLIGHESGEDGVAGVLRIS